MEPIRIIFCHIKINKILYLNIYTPFSLASHTNAKSESKNVRAHCCSSACGLTLCKGFVTWTHKQRDARIYSRHDKKEQKI